MQWVCCYFLELVNNNWFYLCYSATVHCGGGANPGWGPSPPPPPTAWPSLNKLASSSQHSRQSQTSTRERDRIARPPSQLILGGWGVAPPPSQYRGPGRGTNKTQGSAPYKAESGSLHFPPTHRTSSGRIRPGLCHHHGWLEKERVRTTEVSTW